MPACRARITSASTARATRRLTADHIALETRIITTADIFDAISADRPYRGAVPIAQTLQIMAKTVGTALDPRCFDALCKAVDQLEMLAPQDLDLAA